MVIVIIGILATVSTATLGGYSSKALISKYRAERQQASLERYEECVWLGIPDYCGPEFIIHRRASSLYKKSAKSPSSEFGKLIVPNINDGEDQYAITPDGKYIFYRNQSDGNKMYKKLFDSSVNDFGEAFTPIGVAGFAGVTLDGKFLIYGQDKLYKKSVEISNGDHGDVLADVPAEFQVQFDNDGEHIYYYNLNDLNLYKKNLNTAKSDLGILSLDSAKNSRNIFPW